MSAINFYLKIVLPKLRIYRWGFPFVKTEGFPNCPPATSHLGISLFKTSVIIAECFSLDRPLNIFFRFFFLF